MRRHPGTGRIDIDQLRGECRARRPRLRPHFFRTNYGDDFPFNILPGSWSEQPGTAGFGYGVGDELIEGDREP